MEVGIWVLEARIWFSETTVTPDYIVDQNLSFLATTSIEFWRYFLGHKIPLTRIGARSSEIASGSEKPSLIGIVS